MPIALLALTLSAFAIGTTEFVIVGLIPTIAADLGVDLDVYVARVDWAPDGSAIYVQRQDRAQPQRHPAPGAKAEARYLQAIQVLPRSRARS